jgi:gas vesicle protein
MGNEESCRNCGGIFLAFLIGGVVGAGVALLLAPKPGEEARGKIKKLVEDVKEKAETCFDEIKEKVVSTVEKGKEVVQEKKSIITTAIEAGKEAYEKEKEKLSKA